jgi:hypothetical protein
VYLSLDSEEQRLRDTEQILAQAVCYFACLLENPNVWDAEAHNPGGQVTEEEMACQNYLSAHVFT